MSGKFLKAINEANEQLMDKGFRTEQLKEKILSKGGIALYYKNEFKGGVINGLITTGTIHTEIFRKNPSSSGWMKWSSMRIWLSAAASNWPENMYSI